MRVYFEENGFNDARRITIIDVRIIGFDSQTSTMVIFHGRDYHRVNVEIKNDMFLLNNVLYASVKVLK